MSNTESNNSSETGSPLGIKSETNEVVHITLSPNGTSQVETTVTTVETSVTPHKPSEDPISERLIPCGDPILKGLIPLTGVVEKMLTQSEETKTIPVTQTPSQLIDTQKFLSSLKTFVSELSGIHGNKLYSLSLYHRLLSKTDPTHSRAIDKHMSAFSDYFKENSDAILEKKVDKLNDKNIKYSDKVNLNIKQILTASDKDTCAIIWKHLLYLQFLLSPSTKLKEILSVPEEKKVTGKDFLAGLMAKIGGSIDVNASSANPLGAIQTLLSSGVLSEIIGDLSKSMENGTIDMPTMLSSLMGMMGNGGGGNTDMMKMMTQMMSMGKQ